MSHTLSPHELGQYPTPAWAAAALVRAHLGNLTSNDFVLEPTCGPGRFLQALPSEVPALGVELCPRLAQQARDLTGRTIITGDFLQVYIPEQPTVVLGNPPFKTALIESILDKSHRLLAEGNRCMFVLPAYFFQTAGRVSRYNDAWSLAQELIPRNIYPGLKHPLVFATFTKDQRRLMVGFSLYHELAYLQTLTKETQAALVAGPATWRALVARALDLFGGEADLSQIYEFVADRRPSENRHWKEQIRKVCQQTTTRVARGRYSKTEQLDMLV